MMAADNVALELLQYAGQMNFGFHVQTKSYFSAALQLSDFIFNCIIGYK